MALENSKTMQNLHKALAGESIARNKYLFYAEAAKANGDDEIARAFEQMAKNEMVHAKFWFELLFGKPSDTKDCLMQAAQGEYHEWHDMYPEFAKQARQDGLEEIAVLFEKVAAIERNHEKRFMTLLAKVGQPPQTPAPQENTRPLPKQKSYGYQCHFCGAIFKDRPDVCDTCHAIGSFETVEYYE